MSVGPHAEIRELAYEMIRLDAEIVRAHERGDWIGVGALVTQREEVQLQRSSLMWDVWRPRARHPKTHAAA